MSIFRVSDTVLEADASATRFSFTRRYRITSSSKELYEINSIIHPKIWRLLTQNVIIMRQGRIEYMSKSQISEFNRAMGPSDR